MRSTAKTRTPRIQLRYRMDTVGGPEGLSQAGVWVQRVVVGQSERPHDHDFLELQVVVKGRGRHRSGLGVHDVQRGDAIVLRPGAWHAYETDAPLTVWVCCFSLERLRDELGWVMDDARLSGLLWRGPMAESGTERGNGIMMLQLEKSLLQRVTQSFEAMRTAMEQQQHAGVVGQLLITLNAMADALPEALRDAPPRDDAVRVAVEALESDIARPWSVAELAKLAHVSEGHLSRRFTQATGLPPLAYLTRLRAERAAALLLRTEEPIQQIGQAVGWDSPAYFARRFKQHFGVSARDYRARSSIDVQSL